MQAVGWAVQSLAAYLIPLALDLILASCINESNTVGWEVANYAFFVLAGLICGALVATLVPASKESGRWVWAGPVALMLFCAISEITAGHFDITSLWFGMGEAGWIKLFVTWPTLGCCTYSAAMQWARRTHSSPGAEGNLAARLEVK